MEAGSGRGIIDSALCVPLTRPCHSIGRDEMVAMGRILFVPSQEDRWKSWRRRGRVTEVCTRGGR